MGWDLKRFADTLNFFGALPIVNLFQPVPNLSITMSDNVIFDFTKANPDYASLWGSLDDVVMGGVSQSSFVIRENSALFTGMVSTANSGGFVSVRTRNFNPPLDLSQSSGIALQVKGDGKRYKFFLRDSTGWDSIAYCCGFDTIAGEWMNVRLPFKEFVPVFRARSVPDAPPLNLGYIRSMQLMLSKFELDGKLNPTFRPGAFALEIASITVVP
ncbi:MAG: CIA30 family protein [Pseudanabaenaceae cyanobacterium SKYGB_i_bin29]|nr:CIA30 family protein [Pseudanabaenaceae cyanobacterium SKYG29]MDW8421574.1 CIA30 family protein [Pseudanabaenaceae cyanobacterium SKYGB_i_bin29]